MILSKYVKIISIITATIVAGSFGYYWYFPTQEIEILTASEQEENPFFESPEVETHIDINDASPEPSPSATQEPVINQCAQEDDNQHYSHTLGFESLTQQSNNETLTIQGSLPSWLKGSFITIGPGIFELNQSKATHWLDGFAMIHQFCIDKETVTYSNRLINSCYYKDCCKKGKLHGGMPEKKKSAWSKLTSALGSSNTRPVYDNTNINIAVFNNQLVALTETPHALPVDKNTLETKCGFAFDDNLETHVSSAHPIFDAHTKEWFGIATQFAHTSNYIIYKMPQNSTCRIPIATIPVGYPSYIHSFGLTKDYIILTQIPLVVSPYDLLLSDTSYIDTFTWKPKNGTTFIVVSRHTGKIVGNYKTEPFFTLHHVNAFQKGNSIIVDLIAYKNPEITKSFTIKNLRNAHVQLPHARLRRYIIDQENNKVSAITLSPHNIELPQINAAHLMHDYQYAYATGSQHGFANQLLKLDLRSKRHQTWHCKGCYPTEAIFVANPNAQSEDDGIIQSLVLDARNQKSFLLFLDAKTFKEIGRAYAPHHIPFTTHSKFVQI